MRRWEFIGGVPAWPDVARAQKRGYRVRQQRRSRPTWLTASLARPAGNATGVTLLLDDIASKCLEFLKEAVPRVRHVAFL
jgi:hypothetical protein